MRAGGSLEATCGSECVAAKIATEQKMDIQNTIQYLGVPIIDKNKPVWRQMHYAKKAGLVEKFLCKIMIVILGCKNEKERAGSEPPALQKDA